MGNKITVGGVLTEGLSIGLKNVVSLLVATLLWLVTIWIPYLNAGTTIAMTVIPVELSKGKVISPTFIFDGKYRQYMGEYFTLIGLMSMSIIPALLFMVVPGLIIALGWSLAFYLLLDKGLAPGEALVQSNKATYGYKWTIFGVNFIIMLAFYILSFIFALIPFIGALLMLVAVLAIVVVSLGCSAVIYRNLTADEQQADAIE